MDQNFPFGGIIGYRDYYSEYNFYTPNCLDYTQFYMMLLEQCGHILV